MNNVILKTANLKTYFFTRRGVVKAVDGAGNKSLSSNKVGEFDRALDDKGSRPRKRMIKPFPRG